LAAQFSRRIEGTSAAPRGIGVAVALAMHAMLVAGLLSYEPARHMISSAVPVMVELITPPKLQTKPEPPVVIPPPPKPRVKPQPRLPDPPPVVAAPVEAPTPVEVAPPPPPAPPPPQPTPMQAVPLAAVAVTAPIFNADYLDNPPPAYPMRSRRLGEQGRVVLRVLVNPAGSADEVQVQQSSGFLRLDDAARETVARWRFVPAKRGERPVPAWVLIPVSFKLEG
jgi:protein TonB